ncbi:hypothetical protein P3339_18905 [Microbulbifer sp. MLAF003]|uniref:hypothetical protein n=1 Tax=unclassified Microbulbifer TaxID=2619833 RepID=UPI0024AD8BC5|nr:hypothetical protein [Microbulbifer sp. MLAF003]WHI50487.1 hypothetical protein P3339_18905 [Microbulbifer sp. MLAF003]
MNYVLISAIAGFVLVLMLGASKNAKPISMENGDVFLKYANSIRGAGLALSIISIGGLFLALIFVPVKTESDARAVIWLFSAAFLFTAYFYIEFFTVKITLKAGGIAGTSGWRGLREYKWSEIEEITYSPVSMWFTIKATAKAPLRIHAWISGIDEFQKHYMANLEKQIWVSAYESALKDERVNKQRQSDR